METRKGGRDVGVLYKQKEQHKLKLLLAHGREPPNSADEKMKPRDGKQLLPKVTQKPPALGSWAPISFQAFLLLSLQTAGAVVLGAEQSRIRTRQ